MKQKHIYLKALGELALLKKENPNFTRADRHQMIHRLTGIAPEIQIQVERYSRAMREIFPKDEVGKKLEAEWHKPEYLHNAEMDWAQTFKRTNQLN